MLDGFDPGWRNMHNVASHKAAIEGILGQLRHLGLYRPLKLRP